MDIFGGGVASPKQRAVTGFKRLERVNKFWVYEFGVLCQTPGFRPIDIQRLIPGLRMGQYLRGRDEVVVDVAHVEENAASVTEEDARMCILLGAMPSYSVLWVADLFHKGLKSADITALYGLSRRQVAKARGSGRFAVVG